MKSAKMGVAIAVFVSLVSIGARGAATLEWYNAGAPDPAMDHTNAIVLSDATGVTESLGALFQLMIASGGAVHLPTSADFGSGTGATGGDALVGYQWANAGGYGDGVAYRQQTYAALNTTDSVYVRVWETPTSGGGNMPAAQFYAGYGTGAFYADTSAVLVSSLPEAGGIYTFEFTPPTSGSWTFLAVPEPSTALFALVGVGTILYRRMRRRD